MRSLLSLVLILIVALGCAGVGNKDEMMKLEIQLRQATVELLEAEEARAALEARLATCNCPEPAPAPAPAPAPVPTTTATAAPTAAPTPVPAPAPAVDNAPGQIEVSATSTVKVLVDGKGCSYNLAKSAYVKKDLAPGLHMVEVRGAMRTIVWSGNVDVPPGKRVRLQHVIGKKELQKLGAVDAY